MGNTIRNNSDMSAAQRARYSIIAGRRDKRNNRAQECEFDARAFRARIATGR